MGNIRKPEFGVVKDELTLNTQDPNAVMYGVTPSNGFIPLKINEAGELQIGGTINLEPGDIQIGAVEIKNHDTDDRVFVSTAHEMRVESRLHDGAGTDLTSTGGALDINLKSGIVKDADDNSIAANQAGLQLGIGLLYGYDGSANWERITQTGGSLDVNVTAGGGGPEDTDDGSIAGGQQLVLGSTLNYGWNGSTWERINSSTNRLIVDGSQVTQPIQGPIANGAAGNPNPVVAGARNADTDAVHSLTTETLFGHEHLNVITVSQRAELVTKDILFGFEDEVNLPSSGVESPAYLLRNPVASGKTIYLGVMSFGIDSDKKASFKIHVSPTITADGTPVGVFSQNVGGSNTEVLDVFSAPTASVLGGGVRHYNSGAEQPSKEIDLDFGIIIQEGEEVLITGIPSANNVLMSVSLEWGEV